jgi:hypothetical protein
MNRDDMGFDEKEIMFDKVGGYCRKDMFWAYENLSYRQVYGSLRFITWKNIQDENAAKAHQAHQNMPSY